VWLVLSGPLAVILAAIPTVYLAVEGADPVLERKAAVTTEPVGRTPDALHTDSEVSRSALPAGVARNHAASPNPPKP